MGDMPPRYKMYLHFHPPPLTEGSNFIRLCKNEGERTHKWLVVMVFAFLSFVYWAVVSTNDCKNISNERAENERYNYIEHWTLRAGFSRGTLSTWATAEGPGAHKISRGTGTYDMYIIVEDIRPDLGSNLTKMESPGYADYHTKSLTMRLLGKKFCGASK